MPQPLCLAESDTCHIHTRQLDGSLPDSQAVEGKAKSGAVDRSSPVPAEKGGIAGPVAASSGKKRKLLDVRTMQLVAAGDQNTDPAAAGVLFASADWLYVDFRSLPMTDGHCHRLTC